ncbi:MAG TPA: hypothetical protein VN721_12730 [Flavipsychrobacter sp.]|nr:hypothetical protein [Flavipsychrobacter sp.]
MKKNLLLLSLLSVMFLISSCEEEKSNMPYIQQMKDTIFAGYPTVAGVTIDVQESTMLEVVLKDASLYNKTDADRQKVATSIGMMALRIFGKDNKLERGELLVSKDMPSGEIIPDDAKKTNINIDSLKKVTTN